MLAIPGLGAQPAGRKPTPAPRTPTSSNELRVIAAYGFSIAGYGKIGFWTPVRVQVRFTPKNPSARLDGSLELLPGPFPQECRYVQPLHMAGQGTKEFEFCVLPSVDHQGENGYEFTLAVRSGITVVSENVFYVPASAAMLETRTRIVVTFASAGSFFLSTRGISGRTDKSSDTRKIMPVCASVLARDLPLSAVAYAGVDTVLWYDPRSGVLDHRQEQALREFVLRGGHLVLAGGPDTRFGTQEWPGLPADFIGQATVNLPCMGNRIELGFANVGLVDSRGQNLQYPVPGTVGEFSASKLRTLGGRVMARLDHLPMLVRKTLGNGRITMLGLDLNDSALGSCPELRMDVLARTLDLPLVARHLAVVSPVKDKAADGNRFKRRQHNLPPPTPAMTIARFIQSAEELQPLPFWFVIIFLLLFFALAGPLNYLVLRKKRKLTWTWTTFAIISLTFTALTYVGALAIKGNASFIREIEVVDLLTDGQAMRMNFLGIFSARPRSTTLDGPREIIAAGLKSANIGRRRFGGTGFDFDISPGGDIILEHEGSITPAQIDMRQWKMEIFKVRSKTPTTWALRADLKMSGPTVTGTVTNQSPKRFDAVTVVTRTNIANLGLLLPGKTCRIKGWVDLIAGLGSRQPTDLKPFTSQATAFLGLTTIGPDQALAISFPLLMRARYLAAKPQTDKQPPMPLGGNLDELLPRFMVAQSHRSSPAQPLSNWRVLDAAVPSGDQHGLDLSRVICQGGVVILGITHCREQPGTIGMAGMKVKRNSYTLVRLVVPASDIGE